MVLNGAYLYNKVIKKDFTRRQLLKFVTYYDNVRLGKYITVLMKLGFIIESSKRKTLQLYSISSKGIDVIKELNNSYQIELD